MENGFGWLFLVLSVSVSLATQPVNLHRIVALMNLSEQAKRRLLRDGVLVVSDRSETNLWKAYDDLTRFHNVPIFVTTDACLYQFYELHKAAIREVESKGLSLLLLQLLKDWASKAYARLNEQKWQREIENAAIVLAVAGKLLDKNFALPQKLSKQVENIVSEVVAARRVVEGFPFGEDFTQYKPRGHYAASETLQCYFRAYKWLARRVYDANKDEQLRTSVLMLWLLEEVPNGFERYRKIVDVILALSGEPVGMTLADLKKALNAVGLTCSQVLEDMGALRKLKEELKKPIYGKAKVVTHPVLPIASPPPQLMPEKQIRPLPEIQLPDAEVLQWTGDPQVPQRMPSGLDVAAALGSQRALELISQSPSGSLVLERIKPFREMWSQWSERDWQRSVYNLWLWAIKSLFEVDERTPEFMKKPVWQDWKLNSALASWAQLRHAYGLYGAPVYIYAGLVEEIPLAYLEPNPKCYERLSIAAEKLAEILSEAGIMSGQTKSHLVWFANLMKRFANIAEKEIRGEPLSEVEAKMLAAFADVISPLPRETPVTVMDIVTHSQTGQVLHVASGKLHPVLVVVDAKPYKPFVAVGWSLSYYEFVRPNFERLTNSDWEKWLDKDVARPEPPEWAYSFRWSAVEEFEGFAELREGENLLSTNLTEAIRLLREVAQRHEGTWVGAKAHLLLARHLAERHEFEEAQREIEAFYRNANMKLMSEAEEICMSVGWRWERLVRWQLAQPYLHRLLELTKTPEKPLPPETERRRQDLRALALLLQVKLLPKTEHEKVSRIVAQVLKECLRSKFVPAAKAILWWYWVQPFTFEAMPTEQQHRQILDEAIKIINEHPSSLWAWWVAGEAKSFALQTLEDTERFYAAVSKLRPPTSKSPDEVGLLSVFSPTASISFDRPPIDLHRLAWLLLEKGEFEKAWEAFQKSKIGDERLLAVFEAWKREGKEVARALVRIERAFQEGLPDDLLKELDSFLQHFPKSLWAPYVMASAVGVYRALGESEKASEIEEQLLRQFPNSEEAKRLIANRKAEEQRKRELSLATENFLKNLLRGTNIDLKPFLSVAQTDLLASLDKLLAEHRELKERIVKQALNEVMKGHQTEAQLQLAQMLRQWLVERFCERHPNDPLAYEVLWQLTVVGREKHISLWNLPNIAPFLQAPEGTPYRERAEDLLEKILAERPERTIERDPFWLLLEYAEQFPTLKPRLFLTAGEWAIEDRDWETAKKLLTYAEKEGDVKVRNRAREALLRIEQLRQPPQKFVKQLWEIDLWQPLLPSPKKAEDCLRALFRIASATPLLENAETDGKWFAMSSEGTLTCIELRTGKIAWRKTLPFRSFTVVDGTVVLVTNSWEPPSGDVLLVTALNAASGKMLWKREFRGERLALGRWQNLLVLAWFGAGKEGKLVFINPQSGQPTSKKTLTWEDFLEWQSKLQSRSSGYSLRTSLTDEEGRLVRMWICERFWKSPDRTIIVLLLPDGKLVAYRATQK